MRFRLLAGLESTWGCRQQHHRWLAIWPLVFASFALSIAVLPVFLVGALGVYIQPDLSMSEHDLGMAIASFFLASAVQAVPAGRLADRIGADRAMLSGIAISFASLLGLASVHPSGGSVMAWMAVAGIGNGTIQPASSRSVFEAMPQARQGMAFGVKQSSAPAAMFVAGLSVPLVAAHWGWLGAVLVALALSAVVFAVLRLTGPSDPDAVRHSDRWIAEGVAPRPAGPTRPARLPLTLLALAAGCGIAVASALGAFFVPFVVSTGLSPTLAGWLLALGSLCSIGARLCWGVAADRRSLDHLFVVMTLLVVGAVSVALLALSLSAIVLAMVTVVVFAAGWGWPGLFQLGVIRQYPGRPAAAAGVVQSGGFVGGVVGPYAFGGTVAAFSFRAAWLEASLALAAAGVLVWGARQSVRPQAEGR